MAFDARQFINDYEEGLINEDGDSVSTNTSRIGRAKEEKHKPVGSMAQQQKVLEVNQFYSGAKVKKGKIND